MATVVGKTSDRIDALLSGLVTDVEVNGGRLHITYHDGTVADAGPVDGDGTVDLFDQTYNFTTSSKTWIVTHNRNTTSLRVDTFDSNGDPVEGDVSYPTPQTVRIDWWYFMTGSVRLQSYI